MHAVLCLAHSLSSIPEEGLNVADSFLVGEDQEGKVTCMPYRWSHQYRFLNRIRRAHASGLDLPHDAQWF